MGPITNMERFLFFCCICIFLNFVNGDTIQNSININCFEDKLQKINEQLLEKINNIRKEKNVVPLTLEHHLVSGSAEWAKNIAETDNIILRGIDCKYSEVMLMFRDIGLYYESDLDPIEHWKEMLTPPNGMFSHVSVPVGQLFWNGTKEIGCGVCSFQDIERKGEHTVVACRVRPSFNSVLDAELF